MKVEVKGKKLLIEMDLEAPHPSKTGKTFIVASSYGIKETEAQVEGKNIYIGLNAFIKK